MDSTSKRGFARLMLRFPPRRADLRRQAGHPHVIELSESYELACEAAAFWSRSDTIDAAARAKEYGVIISELEQELLLTLDLNPHGSQSRS